jgi:hypothetical protein
MPDAPAKPKGSMGMLTRKVGPLPVWVWTIALAGIGYYLYRRSHPTSSTSSSTGSTGTAPTDQTTYVPPFDAASVSGSGGIGSTAVPSTVNNYYYGDTAAAQATGGGTSPGKAADGSPLTATAAAAAPVAGHLNTGGVPNSAGYGGSPVSPPNHGPVVATAF